MAIRVSRQFVEVLKKEPGEIRVSRQHVEVLKKEPGEIRVSRQHIEVLSPIPPAGSEIFASAGSTLSVSSSSSPAGSVYGRSAFNTLTLTDSGRPTTLIGIASNTLSMSSGLSREIDVFAENTLNLTSSGQFRGPISVSASNTLEMSVSTRIPREIFVEASSTIELSQGNHPGGSISRSASNTLNLQQTADTSEKHRFITNELVLTHSVDVISSKVVSSQLNLSQSAHVDSVAKGASSTLNLTQFARVEPRPQSASSTLNLSQTARSQFQFALASSTLELSQDVVVAKPIRVSAESNLTQTEEVWDPATATLVTNDIGLRQSVSITGNVNRTPSSQLGITQTAHGYVVSVTAIAASASSNIILSQSAWGSVILAPAASNTLVLTQSTDGSTGPQPASTLELTQSATYSVERAARPASSTLELGHAVTYTLETATTKHQYAPFVGEVTDLGFPDPPPLTLDHPMWGIEVPFQLLYPSLGVPTDTCSLKAPNLGNKDRLSFNRVLHETRGGTLVVFADPIWPKVQTLVLTFSGLLRVEAVELQMFINDHLGKEIGLIDWEHRYWRGIITSPDEPIIEDKFDSFTMSFEFEGERDPLWNPQIVPFALRYSPTQSEQMNGYYVPNDPILPEIPGPNMSYETIVDSTVVLGQPLYIQAGNYHLDLAKADALATSQVVGLSASDYTAGESCLYYSDGSVERVDWTPVTGSGNLVPGNSYFLDPVNIGRLTNTAPTTAGQLVVRVGRAVTARTLDIEVELPILL